MKELDTNTKSALMKRIDDFVENERSEQPGVPDTTIMMPELNRVAEEYSLDVSDLFIAYLDHIAITNKRVAQEAEEELDFSKIRRFY
ncbi:unknown [Firmicutes bacterium CAG:882]|jgi:hypothetical protein|nr:unknown [Firmicutes bacterium CAG:882]